MAYGYWKQRKADLESVFYLFFRKNPFQGGYTIAAGLFFSRNVFQNQFVGNAFEFSLAEFNGWPEGVRVYAMYSISEVMIPFLHRVTALRFVLFLHVLVLNLGEPCALATQILGTHRRGFDGRHHGIAKARFLQSFHTGDGRPSRAGHAVT